LRILLLPIFLAYTLAGAEKGQVNFTASAKAETVKAGEAFEVTLEFKIAPGWHIGARKVKNAIPTELEWTLPEGVKLLDVAWPKPNYFGQPIGYVGKATLRAKLQAAKSLKPGAKLNIGVRSSWQVCKGVCKLGEAKKLVKVSISK
jgi:DsbC/DsbD-like thiol-disulfide interchange protein